MNKLNLYEYEEQLYNQGLSYIAGVDEVGRGPLVGPVVVACCVLPRNFQLDGLNDSKKLSQKKREIFYDIIIEQALAYEIVALDSKIIDELNIYQATKKAMTLAILAVNKKVKLDHALIDAMPLDIEVPTTSIIKGDSKSISIAAASVLAKVYRDRLMNDLHEKYPEYNFKKHKGYPTKEHLAAIEQYGIIEEHRLSYKPVSDYANKQLKFDI